MEFKLTFSPRVAVQLKSIERYIVRRSSNSAIAKSFIARIVKHCETLEVFPERGAKRDDILQGLRIIPYGKQINIAFRVFHSRREVQVLGVYYAGQLYDELAGAKDLS